MRSAAAVARASMLVAGAAAALAAAALAAGCGDDLQVEVLPEVTDPVPLVDPTIGSGGLAFTYGAAFVGAAVPHGLVKVGPDTDGPNGTVSFLHFSGYWAGDDRIQGFSHLHLHGAGVQDLGVLSVMPTTAFDPHKTSVVDYEAHFAKADEIATAGEYAVKLDSGIGVDLAATAHCADHAYDFGAAADGELVIDLAKSLGGTVDAADVHLDAASRTVTGHLHARGGMSGNYGGFDLYFVAESQEPWERAMVWSNGADAAVGTDASGTGVGAMLQVAGPDGLHLHVGVSLVSLDGARANLALELPAFDPVAVRATARKAWRDALGVVRITGGTAAERRIFYTSLYHTLLMPTVISDSNGQYQLAGQSVRQARGLTMYSDLSLWDTYRTVVPLYALLWPSDAVITADSLIDFATTTGAYPRWPILVGEGGAMLGASAEIAIADTEARVGAVDIFTAWSILSDEALAPTPHPDGRGERAGVDAYMPDGWAPSTTGRSVSLTTEFSADDFALAVVADRVGDTVNAQLLRDRSHGWTHLYDPSVGFLRARHPDGTFPTGPFDPIAQTDDYAEANAWQSLWMAGLHDPAGLVAILGGPDLVVAKLEAFFEQAQADWEANPTSLLPRPYYWHGNEPDLDAVWLFTLVGRPDLTQRWQRWILDTQYTDQPDGLQGNDDGGTLGAWYVLAALGLYPVPGSDQWVIGAPRFPSVRVSVNGVDVLIEAPDASAARPYVQSVTLDGQPVPGPYLSQAQLSGFLVNGGGLGGRGDVPVGVGHVLHVEMGAQPGAWGQSAATSN